MKMRGVLWGVALSLVLAQTEVPGKQGTELVRPRAWRADLGQVDTKECDACRCSGTRTKRCNEATGRFDPEANNCTGNRWWGPWSNPKILACQVINGKAVIPEIKTRTCGCGGQMPPGGCWEGIMGISINNHGTCKAECLCGDPKCQLSVLAESRTFRPGMSNAFCMPESLLEECNSQGVCRRAGYRDLEPHEAGHPQSGGKTSLDAAGSYTCPDMWPKVKVDSGSQPVVVKARCGCGYKGIQTRTCRADGCSAQWTRPDRTQCVKIDWNNGCDNWGPCQPNSGGKCGAGTQRCRRTCNTTTNGYNGYNDCLHAAHAGCIDPNTHLEKECFVNPPSWSHWGPWGWVRDSKFHTGWEQPQWNELALHYLNEGHRNPACGQAEQVRYYQCSTRSRQDCLEACKYNCYQDQQQQAICNENKKTQRLVGRPCVCVEEDDVTVCPAGVTNCNQADTAQKKSQAQYARGQG